MKLERETDLNRLLITGNELVDEHCGGRYVL